MIRVGLTGGLGCGKSYVGRILEEQGCHVIRADELGKRVLALSGEAYHAFSDAFGTQFLNQDGSVDRALLADSVFREPEQLKLLNSIVHPAVFRLEKELLASAEKVEPQGIGVVEAAILIEAGNFLRFDKIIVVSCTEEQQIARTMRRDGWTEEQVRSRLSRQMPLGEKEKYADYIIDTSGSEAQTREQVHNVYKSLATLSKTSA